MIAKVKKSDFEAETAPLRSSLSHVALKLCGGDPTTAEDMVQDTYMKAWRNFHRFQPGTNLRAWLYRILFNNVVSEYRHRKHVKERPYPVGFEPKGNLGSEAGQALDWEHVTDEVKNAFDLLPEEYREVFLLASVEDRSVKEIAEILNVPVGTVMSRLWRAKQQLQAILTKEAPPSLN